MKKINKALVLVVFVIIATVILVGCQSTKNKTANLLIVEQSSTDTINQPKPIEKRQSIKVGDVITVKMSADIQAEISVKNINDNEIELSFKTNKIVKVDAKGHIDMDLKKYSWSDKLFYNKEYTIATTTYDEGISWTFIVEK